MPVHDQVALRVAPAFCRFKAITIFFFCKKSHDRSDEGTSISFLKEKRQEKQKNTSQVIECQSD